MGTDCHIVVVGPGAADLVLDGADVVRTLESRWSRFLPGSEISRLNRSTGNATTVSAETIGLVITAIGAWELTGGGFDPTLGLHLEALGYDVPFEELAAADRSHLHRVEPTQSSHGCAGIEVDHRRSTVTIPPGVAFDPGGIGKGYAADLVAARLMEAGAWGAMVNLGGDLRVAGTPPSGDAWSVRIAEPAIQDSALATVRLNDAGLATSTTRRRRWHVGGDDRHHLLNPTTGLPQQDGPQLVSIIAGEAWWAEAQATAQSATGGRSPEGEAAGASGCSGMRVHPDGSIESFGEFERYVAAS